MLLVSSVVASGAVPVFGAYLPTYAAFFFPTILPHLGFALLYGYPLHWLMAGMIVAYLVAMPLIARVAYRQLVESSAWRFENIDLIAEDLRLQKELADQANRAKSSFLAAASHDLRQPLHALGLFIAALRGRAMDAEAGQLVDHIDESVGAMDDLFASLLDILPKLDAGVVEAHLELGRGRPAAGATVPRAHRRGGRQGPDPAPRPLLGGGVERPRPAGTRPAQHPRQRRPLHRPGPGDRRLSPGPDQPAHRGLGHRPRHRARPAGGGVPGVLPDRQSRARPHQGAGPRASHCAPRAAADRRRPEPDPPRPAAAASSAWTVPIAPADAPAVVGDLRSRLRRGWPGLRHRRRDRHPDRHGRPADRLGPSGGGRRPG